MKTILITGGCGYIGKNMVDKLIEKNYNVIVLDSLINSSKEAINPNSKFYQVDIRDFNKINEIFEENKIDLVMDFAALLDVEESMHNPQEYFSVNVDGLLNILNVMKKHKVNKIMFSSTAAVYESSNETVVETSKLNPINIYGLTKKIGEELIEFYSDNFEFEYIIFRYFNVAGSKKIGYSWSEFTSVVPKILSALKKDSEFTIYGDTYDTKDGTCIRDYIHMEDLILAHYEGIEKFDILKNDKYNLGVGNGTSVKELVEKISEIFNINVSIKYGDNRPGDIVYSVADSTKFKNKSNWKVKYNNIEKIIQKIKIENKEIGD